MRTSTCPTVYRSRAAIATLAVASALAVPAAAAETIVKQKPHGAAIDFQQFLPPVAPVPWLDAKWRAPHRNVLPLPEAGSVSALLLAPQPAKSWAPGSSQAASANPGFARM